MRDDHRQRIGLLRPDVNEVNVEPIDVGDELRVRIQLRLCFPPVVLLPPVARELLHRRELDPLRRIRHGLAVRPLGGGDAATQIHERLIGRFELERANRRVTAQLRRGSGANHGDAGIDCVPSGRRRDSEKHYREDNDQSDSRCDAAGESFE